MTESFRIGTIAGVRVGVNWSVLVIFLLLLFGLSAGHFPGCSRTAPRVPTWWPEPSPPSWCCGR
jgi:hypothetical protein